jgi:hypothetical protein
MALVFMFNVILPESHKKVYYGREGSQPQLASLQVHAQQSVQPTGGILPRFQAFFWLRAFSCSRSESRPAHQRLTQTVGRFSCLKKKDQKIISCIRSQFGLEEIHE